VILLPTGVALVIFFAYQGISISEKALLDGHPAGVLADQRPSFDGGVVGDDDDDGGRVAA